ncbi:YcxB family protein [Rubritalea spongiae]|uniref:YcxB family protein n=1 Tax=Rubritalea spongiae TaxID=430797 RepID=A0ABW5E1F8_9BACT
MAKPITIITQFDGKSQHGSFPQHMWHRYRWWVITRSLLCIAAICLGAYLMEPGSEGGLIGGGLVMVGSLGFMRPMLWQMWQERGLRKHPAYNSKVRYTFSENGISMAGKAGEADVAWNELHELKQSKKGLLIYKDKKQYIWIANDAFEAGQMEAILGMWQQSGK